jgi:hypothetical protein
VFLETTQCFAPTHSSAIVSYCHRMVHRLDMRVDFRHTEERPFCQRNLGRSCSVATTLSEDSLGPTSQTRIALN